MKRVAFNNIFVDDTHNVFKIPRNKYIEYGKIPIVDQGKEYISGYSDDNTKNKIKDERIIFGDHTRIIKYINFEAYIGADGIKVLKIKKDNISYKYMYYYLKNSFIPNTGYNRHFKWLKQLEFIIPTLEEQIEVVNELDKVQEIIDIRKKQINELDELIKSQFVEMFGNLKLNDKGWEYIDKIGNICILNPKKNEIANLDNIEVSFIPMQNVSDKGDINIEETRLLNDVKKGFSYFKENDVLFAKITPCMENGKGAIAKGLKNNIGFGSTEFHILRPQNNINSIWLYTLTSLSTFRKEAEMKMTGSAGQKRVPINFFEDYKIGLPPLKLQNQFANIVKQINKQKFEMQNSLEETQKLQESLMNKYF